MAISVIGGQGGVVNVTGDSKASISVGSGGSVSVSVAPDSAGGVSIGEVGGSPISVSPTGEPPISLSVTGGIGPTIIVNGTSTSVVGSLGVQPFVAGKNVTITTDGGGITISAFDQSVASVQGKTGTVTLTAADLTAAAAVHTHSTSQIAGLSEALQAGSPVQSVQGKVGVVSLVASDITAASAAHTHLVSQISGFTAAVQANSKVQSVQGKSGVVTLVASDLTAASAYHTHSVASVADFAQGVSQYSPVKSVNGMTGNVVINSVVGGQAGNSGKLLTTSGVSTDWVSKFSVVSSVLRAGNNITLTTSESSGTISISGSSQGIQWVAAPASPYSPGSFGDIARDNDYLYVCVGAGYLKQWKRAAISTWAPVDSHFANVQLLLHLDAWAYGTWGPPGPLLDTSSFARTVNEIGSVQKWLGPTQYNAGYGIFGGTVSFDSTIYGGGLGYLSIPYNAAWDSIGWSSSFTIEFWIKITSFPSARTKIIGTDGWGIFVTPQSEQDYGDPYRLEAISFRNDQTIDYRSDCGPISAGVWTYVRRDTTRTFVGTTPGEVVQSEVVEYFYDIDSYGSALTIGGDSSGSLDGFLDEIRITNPGRPFSWPLITPNYPFPDA